MPVSNFCISSTLSNSSDAMLQKPSFNPYSFKPSSFINLASQRSFCHSKFSGPKILTTPKSSISFSPTNCNDFSFLILSVSKSNHSKPACTPPQTSNLWPFPIKSSRHLFQSSSQVCQSIFSQNRKVFNSASLFQVSELPFQRNATATLPFTIILLSSSAICIFLLNLFFSFILLTCSSYSILNFNILIYILLTVLVFIKFYINSAGLLFRLMESNRSLIILIIEFINIFQYDAIFHKMTISNMNLINKALLIVVPLFLKVKFRNALHCNIVSSENLLKLIYLCHLIRKFSNFSQFSLAIFFCIHMKRVFTFLYYTASFILVIAIDFCQSSLFWDCANGFVNIFNVHNDFNATNNFIRFLNFTHSFVEVNVDVIYDDSRNLSELMNESKPGINDSNKNAISIFLFLTSSFFHLLIKQNPDIRVKIIPLAIFSFIGSHVKNLQPPTPHHEINVCSQSHFFTIELINKFESLYTSHLHSQSVFLSVSQL